MDSVISEAQILAMIDDWDTFDKFNKNNNNNSYYCLYFIC